jgi:crotonobetainyl-CoA:carnitine CoA-transferase CaiB-like acyl-CoA transferase
MSNSDNNMLQGLHIVDCSAGMATALVCKYLADNGATVTRVDFGDEHVVAAYYPAYSVWYQGMNSMAADAQSLDKVLRSADACVLGGESFPSIDRQMDAGDIARRYPDLVVLDVSGNPHGIKGTHRPSTDILAQARSGLCFEHYSDRPLVMGFEPANYGAALQALAGLLAALYEKTGSGKGQIVHTSLLEGCLTWVMQIWGDYEKPAPSTTVPLKDLHPLIFQCADGVWVHVVLGSAGSKYKLYSVLGIDDPTVKPGDSGMPDPANPDRRNYFGDIDLLAEYVGKFDSKPLLEAMRAEGLAVEVVRAPGECWDIEQVQFNGTIRRRKDGVRHVGNPLIVNNQTAGRDKLSPAGRLLEGVRVLDLGAYVAGPLASRVLCDLGASVVKVEPTAGEPTRAMARSYLSSNSGKRGMALDLKNGADIARKLAANVDIVTNNFRSGVSARLGVDPDSLHKIREDLIVLESPGYGTKGPQAKHAAFDLVMQAVCGHEAKGGGEGNTPFWNRTYMVDFTGGMLGAVALLTALNHRVRGGGGASLEMPLLNAGVFLLSELIQQPDGSCHGVRQLNSSQTGYLANEALYQAGDGWLAIVARSEQQKAALGEVLGLDGLSFDSNPQAVKGDYEAIKAAVSRWQRDDLVAALERRGVWVEVCRDSAEADILNDPAFQQRGTVKVSEHHEFRCVKEIAALVTFTPAFRGASALGACRLGEHSQAVLVEVGYNAPDIAKLKEQGVVA